MEKSPKEEFIDLMVENARNNGLNELNSKIMGILYAEPNEISLEELAEKTGYSLSAICTEIRLIEGLGLLKRIKKPKSKKVFFYMGKDILSFANEMMKKKYEGGILRSKIILPKIIEKYKLKKMKSLKEKEEFDIIRDYYKQVLVFEDILKKTLEMFEKINEKKFNY